MRRPAGPALAGGGRFLEPQDALDLVEFGIDVLKHRGVAHEDIHPDPITDRHLVNQPSEVPLELGQTRVQLIPAILEVNRGLGGGREERAA